MRTQKLPNGNIAILADNEDRHELAELYQDPDKQYPGAEQYVLEGLHEILYEVKPEWIGALTEAPIFAEHVNYEDDDTVTVEGNIYWFPNYMITDPYRVLANRGKVVFTLAT